jgi:hypothetical protein
MQVERVASATSGARVRNAYATYLKLGDSLPKGRLIPHNTARGHLSAVKDLSV